MRQLGARSVPVLAKGAKYVWAQNPRDLAAFLDMSDKMPKALSGEELLQRWMGVLLASQRNIRHIRGDMLPGRVLAGGKRTVRMLSGHIFRIAEGFLETVNDGWTHDPNALEYGDDDVRIGTLEGILGYSENVLARVAAYQRQFKPEMTDNVYPTKAGPQDIRLLLERSTCHSAQHARQLEAVLEREGVPVDEKMGPKELGGLPLPERLFE